MNEDVRSMCEDLMLYDELGAATITTTDGEEYRFCRNRDGHWTITRTWYYTFLD